MVRNRATNMFASTSVVALMALALPAAALAQPAPETTEDVAKATASESAEIIVTANKRAERLLDVAQAVTALDGRDLLKRNLPQIENFATQVPALSVQSAGNRATRVILRGLNAGGSGATVATVIDESALSYASATSNGAIDIANFDTYDLARIEVLRGPQGTLYGAAAQGGIIKYVTNAPDLDKTAASVEGNLEIVDGGGIGSGVRGFFNLPFMNGRAALRVTGFYKDIAGYIDNTELGFNDFNSGERYGGRAQLLFQATDDLTIRLAAIAQKQNFNDGGQLEVNGAFLTPGDPPDDQFEIANNGRLQLNSLVPAFSNNQTTLYYGIIDWSPDFADIISATSYGTINSTFSGDATNAVVFPGFTFGDFFQGVFGRPIRISQRQTNDLSKFNQEVRISSKPDSKIGGLKLDWQAGVFYSHEDITFDQFFDFLERDSDTVITEPLIPGGSSLPADYNEVSLFGTTRLHFTDQFNIEVGGRYSWNWQQSQVTNFAGFLTGPTDTINAPRESSEGAFTWSVAPQFQINDLNQVYARIATGYRPGGPTLAVPGVPAGVLPDSYLSDSTINYEIGYKGLLFNNLLTVDVAAFYIDWTDIQIITLVDTPAGPYAITGNAGQATSQGFEWSFTLAPLPGLTIGDVGAYVDAKLTVDAPALGAANGDRLPYVPNWTNTVNIDYNWTMEGDVRGFVGGSWAYVGTRYTGFSPSANIASHQELPSYNLLSAQAGVEIGRLRFEVYGTNLTNNQTLVDYQSNGGPNGTGLGVINTPRTIGFRAAFTY